MANPFSEEYQWQVLERSLDAIEATPGVIGAQAWVFADFMSKATVKRVVGNKKGLFTRDRQPKLAAHRLRERWRSASKPKDRP